MNTPTTDIETRARQLYRRAGPQVDARTAARLRTARQRALESHSGRRRTAWLVPAGACAVALFAAVVIWQPMQSPATARHAVASSRQATDVLPPDTDRDDPGLYQHMGFYAWLARQPDTSSGHGR